MQLFVNVMFGETRMKLSNKMYVFERLNERWIVVQLVKIFDSFILVAECLAT